jgi:hypothetical protein
MIFRGDALPKKIQGQAFVVDGPTNIVHLLKLMDDGTGKLRARDYYQKGEFLASVDERFRPVDLALGWDGTLYIVDMYRVRRTGRFRPTICAITSRSASCGKASTREAFTRWCMTARSSTPSRT